MPKAFRGHSGVIITTLRALEMADEIAVWLDHVPAGCPREEP